MRSVMRVRRSVPVLERATVMYYSDQKTEFFSVQLVPVLDASSLFSNDAKMDLVRTYFLETIAKDEEKRYSVCSSVISCLELRATAFAKIDGKNRIASREILHCPLQTPLSLRLCTGLSSKAATSLISSGAGEAHGIR